MYIIHNLDTAAAAVNESTCLEYMCILTWNEIFIATLKLNALLLGLYYGEEAQLHKVYKGGEL